MWQGQHKAWGINIQSASILFLFLDAIASQGYGRMFNSQARMKREDIWKGLKVGVSSSRV